MNIFLAGATGFVGSRVLEDLLAAGHSVTVLVRTPSSGREIQAKHPNVQLAIGEVSRVDAMKGIVPAGTNSIIYLPGLLRDSSPNGKMFQGVHVQGVMNLIAEAKRVGAKRWIQMSAIGADATSATKYYLTKGQGEQAVMASGLDWTIIRPSAIFGDKPSNRPNFVGELAKAIRMAPAIPVFGDGSFRLQPVSVDDVSQTVVQSLSNPQTIGQIYELGGPEKITFEQMCRIIAADAGKPDRVLHIPFGLIEPIVRVMQGFSFFPLTLDQLTMLKGENIVRDPLDDVKTRSTFRLPMRQFESGGIGVS